MISFWNLGGSSSNICTLCYGGTYSSCNGKIIFSTRRNLVICSIGISLHGGETFLKCNGHF